MKSFVSYQMRGNSPHRKLEVNNGVEKIFGEMQQHALESPDREVCGFGYEDRYVRLTNLAEDPNSFYADPAEIAQCLSRYGEPVAIFHSHPNGGLNPSVRDVQLASYYKNSTIIIGTILNGELCYVVAPPQLDPAPAVQP